MAVLESFILFDISAIIIILLMGYLSKQLGVALKIPPFYRIIYSSGFAIFIAAAIDLYNSSVSVSSLIIRVTAAGIAFFFCLPYWKWLFTEYFFKKR